MTSEPHDPFLAAAAGVPAHRTPVWFMRQAGRSLPEYRAVRGEGSILEAIKKPELAAEITLQPVRRYGVDAAVLYSDIVVPAHAVGFGIDVAPGTGPVAPHPLRTSADLPRLRELELGDIEYVTGFQSATVASHPVICSCGTYAVVRNANGKNKRNALFTAVGFPVRRAIA